MVGRPRCSHRFSGLTMSQVMSATAPPIRSKNSDFVATGASPGHGARLMDCTPLLPRLEDQKPPQQLLLPLASGSEGGILAAMLSPPSEDPLSDGDIDLAVTMRCWRGPPPPLLLPSSPLTSPPAAAAVETTTNLFTGLSPTMLPLHLQSLSPTSLIMQSKDGTISPATPSGCSSSPSGSAQLVCTTPSGIYVPVNVAALSALAEFIDATVATNDTNKCPKPPPLRTAAASAAEGNGAAISEGRDAWTERRVLELLTSDSLSGLQLVVQQALASPPAPQTSRPDDDESPHTLAGSCVAGSPSEGGLLVWPQLPCLLGLPTVLPEEIQLHERIGKGSYGEVFAGRRRMEGA